MVGSGSKHKAMDFPGVLRISIFAGLTAMEHFRKKRTPPPRTHIPYLLSFPLNLSSSLPAPPSKANPANPAGSLDHRPHRSSPTLPGAGISAPLLECTHPVCPFLSSQFPSHPVTPPEHICAGSADLLPAKSFLAQALTQVIMESLLQPPHTPPPPAPKNPLGKG